MTILLLALMAQVSAAPPPSAGPAHRQYDDQHGYKLVPLLAEVLRFPTVAGNDKARRDQQAWLVKTGTALGLKVREAGLVTEIELPGPEGAPVLGLLVHGDVQPVEADKWTIPPFEGACATALVLGRGSADDKGPLVQALLAMIALRDSGLHRTHTVRLLVGSDEESGNKDIAEYLKDHMPPAYSLVLDSAFPVVVGEKAWNALYLTTPIAGSGRAAPPLPYEVTALEAGLSPSIVPDQAQHHAVLAGRGAGQRQRRRGRRAGARAAGEGQRGGLAAAHRASCRRASCRRGSAWSWTCRAIASIVTARGKSAHGGVNLEGGRNALVGLAQALDGRPLPAAARRISWRWPVWWAAICTAARWGSRPATRCGAATPSTSPRSSRSRDPAGRRPTSWSINLRRTPPLTGPQLKTKLEAWVAAFNKRTGAALVAGGFYEDEPLVFDPRSRLVRA